MVNTYHSQQLEMLCQRIDLTLSSRSEGSQHQNLRLLDIIRIVVWFVWSSFNLEAGNWFIDEGIVDFTFLCLCYQINQVLLCRCFYYDFALSALSPLIKCEFLELVDIHKCFHLLIGLKGGSGHALSYLAELQFKVHSDHKDHLVIFLIILKVLLAFGFGEQQSKRIFLAGHLPKRLLHFPSLKAHFNKFQPETVIVF